MLLRASLLSTLAVAFIFHPSLAQELANHRFIVEINDEGATLTIAPADESEASKEPNLPDDGIRIVCDAANMSTLQNGRVIIDCSNGEFSSAKGVTGESERIICDVTDKVVTFQNNDSKAIELSLAAADGDSYSLIGVSISLDLSSNQFRAHSHPMQMGLGQSVLQPIANGRPQLQGVPSLQPNQSQPPIGPSGLAPPTPQNSLVPANRAPQIPLPPRDVLDSRQPPPPSLLPEPSTSNEFPSASNSSPLDQFSFFVGLIR